MQSPWIGGHGPAGLAWSLQSAGAGLTELVTLTIFVTRQVTELVTIAPAWGENLGENPRFLATAGVGMGFAYWLVPGRGRVEHRAAGVMIQPRIIGD